jgi:3-oxoadipate CoA-transferase, beta subunit
VIEPLTDEQVARRVAEDIPDGAYVNLGIGMPTLVADCVGPDKEIVYHSENGILGMGPAPAPGEENWELINAGKQPVTLLPGGSYFHHTDAFLMMRGGHIDVTVLGAFQVSERGDLANWATDVAGMPHTIKDGRPKLLPHCTFPLTAARVVDRVYTDLAVVDVAPDGFLVREMAPGLTRDELQGLTAAQLGFADDVREIPRA